MEIDKKMVEYVARLARLEINEREKDVYTRQLGNILNYVEMLNELDTTNVEPVFHVVPLTNVLREDEVKEGISSNEALRNAPEKENGFFKVPRIIE
ncbi:MAG: Asp-tRNA(Asn)/Glu-tRNA(Gln) amidotransferase subunit GatC [Candidatus Syntrophonatronum acetioxidans]|uniref:Aspartyl/glutamyl-tRNA(Asn/Gln) amidotransferase subunit C n=1 Tax=Candidatus Syntrophonatronum acetioxidans TaxID=1795816 RepID=A0A424YD01_9FIRM|nr:MAG: Asp-tRNA(Asn)/Glu-tRNA(Gln) amidotransferase subunit GatC [Candidatus Syntrophonatronum acetioxidans]